MCQSCQFAAVHFHRLAGVSKLYHKTQTVRVPYYVFQGKKIDTHFCVYSLPQAQALQAPDGLLSALQPGLCRILFFQQFFVNLLILIRKHIKNNLFHRGITFQEAAYRFYCNFGGYFLGKMKYSR